MTARIVFLPGDGIGPEITASARAVLKRVATLHDLAMTLDDHPFGGAAIDQTGTPFPADTRAACLEADAIFLGAVGGPKWDGAPARPEQGLLAIRKELGLFANLRPTRIFECLRDRSPIRVQENATIDFLIVRELTGGIYFGEREEGNELASDVCAYSRSEVERIADVAFRAAQKRRGHVTSVDKANVLASSRLWRRTVISSHVTEYPDIALDHELVDAMAMKLITSPERFDVILTENMFGDILSDEASVLTGSIGLAPSASLGAGPRGLYEPIHGSAPDIAGEGIANPIGAIASIAMLLRHSLNAIAASDATDRAVEQALEAGHRTRDLGGSLSTEAMTERVLAAL